MTNGADSGFSDAVEADCGSSVRSQPLLGLDVTGALMPQRPDKMTNGADSDFSDAVERAQRQLGRSQPLLCLGVYRGTDASTPG